MKPTVLLISHSGDFYTIDLVQKHLISQGVQAIRINSDLFPEQIKISETIDYQNHHISLCDQGIQIDSKTVQAVWLRKVWTPKISEEVSPEYRQACIASSSYAFNLFLQTLHHAFWMDPLTHIQKAENKFRQLQLAKIAGLNIPQTLITNDGLQLQSFYEKLEGNLVTKMLTPLSYGMNASSFFVHTSKVEAAHVQDANLLKHCPMIFQEMIPKAYELRVIYVDGQFFVGKINATQTQAGQTDWRKSAVNEACWESYTLPVSVQTLLHRMMQQHQLLYGAIDMIRTPQGEYVFLEVNPCGEWGMIEKELNEPIAAALANALIKRLP